MLLYDGKIALGVIGVDFDGMISDLIEAAKADLGITDIDVETIGESNPLLKRAIITYCRLNFSVFGLPEGYDQLKRSYDELKAQMSMATGYTEWV